VTAGADARVKGFANACHKGEKDIAEGVVLEGVALEGIALEGIACREDKKGKRRREEVITSLVRVELKRLRRNTIIISLSSTSVFASLSFV
jgi:hypothetical protein